MQVQRLGSEAYQRRHNQHDLDHRVACDARHDRLVEPHHERHDAAQVRTQPSHSFVSGPACRVRSVDAPGAPGGAPPPYVLHGDVRDKHHRQRAHKADDDVVAPIANLVDARKRFHLVRYAM